jgi:hypothetical protein
VKAHEADLVAQGVTASVTILFADATTPAADVDDSVYVIVRFDEKLEFVMLVTTVCGAVVRVMVPALAAPGGAASEMVMVTPAGSTELSDATSFFVVPDATFTRYFAVAVDTVVGALPATAALIFSDPVATVN